MSVAYHTAPSLDAMNVECSRDLSSWRKATSCPVCGDGRIVPFATLRHIPHSRCRDCGFTFANPLPPDELLGDFYNSSYYANFRQFELDRACQDHYFSVSLYRDIRSLANWLTSRLDDDRSLSVLDFGCGPAAFLALLRDEYGFEHVEGLDINRDAVEVAKRLHNLVVKSSVDELDQPDYDVVLLMELVEHVPDPAALFSQVARLIKRGGRIFITTPAVNNLVGRLLPSHSAHYSAPFHVSMFTMLAVRRLLARFDFDVQASDTDTNVELIQALAVVPFYDLDFLSPGSASDASDLLHVPTAL